MSNIAPAFVTINPSYTVPELLLPYSQASGAFDVLPGGEPMARLSEGDLVAYINRIDVRTKMAAGQAAFNSLPSVSIAMSQIKTPTYLQRVRAEYDHHDTAAMARRGVSIVAAQRLGMRQGHFQLGRVALLQGYNPANGEGMLNTAGATAVPLPADQYGNDTVVTYDNGAMAFFWTSQVAALKTRTNQVGIGRKFVILGPQRCLSSWEYNVVQLVQYQRPGSGTSSTAGTVKHVLMDNGDEVIWACDDTLIGQGVANGNGATDAILLIMPEVEKPEGSGWNTNEFAKLAPGLEACTMMLCDMVAPREIPVPLPGGVIDVTSELRSTSGWGVRPEAITIASMQYQ